MSELRDMVSGLPNALKNTIGALVDAVEGIKDELASMGEAEIDTAGPEEEKTGMAADETGANQRRVTWRQRRTERKALKNTPEVKQNLSNVNRRISSLENALKDVTRTLKVKAAVKQIGTGNRAIFSCQMTNVAAGATTASGNVVANAATYYDRVGFVSNIAGVITTVRAAGNQVIDGSDALAVADGKMVGPIEMAEPIQLAGTSGASASFTNRGAAAGDASVVFVPTGHSYGSAAPNAF